MRFWVDFFYKLILVSEEGMRMNRTRERLLLVLGLGVLVLSPDLFANDRDYGRNYSRDYDYAQVTSVEPIVKIIRVSRPREECWQEEVVYVDKTPRHYGPGHGTGSVLGAVLGGAFGNAVGHRKRNKQVGTIVGAVLGASLAASASSQSHGSHRNGYTKTYATEERCKVYQDYQEEERILGYRVKYRYNERNYITRMDRDPGDRLKVRLSVSPVI